MKSNKLITIKTVDDQFEAHIIKDFLNNNGIPSFIMGEIIHSSLWHLRQAFGGIKIMVYESDLNEAFKLLEQQNTPPKENEQKKKIGFFRLILSILITIFFSIPTPLKEKKRK